MSPYESSKLNTTSSRRHAYSVYLASTLLLSACSGEPESEPSNAGMQAPDDMATAPNNSTSAPDMAAEQDMKVCEPATACSADVCGQIDDGCGGTLDCGACACESGVTTQVTCGPCGLGKRTCGDGETGPGMCTIPRSHALRTYADRFGCEHLVHVSNRADPDLADGSIAQPFVTIADAVRGARAGSIILVEQGEYTNQAPVQLQTVMAIVGGMNADYVYTPDARTSITFAPLDDTDSNTPAAGIRVSSRMAAGSLFAWLDVTGPSNTAHRETELIHTYGATLLDTQDITFADCTVTAGSPFQAKDGVAGQNGPEGPQGQDGDVHQAGLARELDGVTRSGGFAGAGGQHDADDNPLCVDTAGGSGGLGGHHRLDAMGASEQVEPGAGLPGAGGAEGGQAGVSDSQRGTIGAIGGSGTGGIVGSDGETPGRIDMTTGLYDASNGNGQDGTPGTPGTGGGGGGGAYWPGDVTDTALPGSSGGGGGAGGCGGAAAIGGTVGASSFGLLAVNTSNVRIVDSSFTAADAMDGGAGATGGRGGAGGRGGQPTEFGLESTEPNTPQTTYVIKGGVGGQGGQGGNGGDAGAGAGGSSFGIYCANSNILRSGTSSITAGEAGQGGTPSTSVRPDGDAAEDFGCF